MCRWPASLFNLTTVLPDPGQLGTPDPEMMMTVLEGHLLLYNIVMCLQIRPDGIFWDHNFVGRLTAYCLNKSSRNIFLTMSILSRNLWSTLPQQSKQSVSNSHGYFGQVEIPSPWLVGVAKAKSDFKKKLKNVFRQTVRLCQCLFGIRNATGWSNLCNVGSARVHGPS